jgi:hypothetical protein
LEVVKVDDVGEHLRVSGESGLGQVEEAVPVEIIIMCPSPREQRLKNGKQRSTAQVHGTRKRRGMDAKSLTL